MSVVKVVIRSSAEAHEYDELVIEKLGTFAFSIRRIVLCDQAIFSGVLCDAPV